MSVHLEWKTLPNDPQNVWIVLTALGKVDVPETKTKIDKLQETLDYFAQHFSGTHEMTFLFDFSKCQDFPKLTMLDRIKKFMSRNDELIKARLRESYILLRDPSWKFWTQALFVFRKPTHPYSFKMADRKLYHALRYHGSGNRSPSV